MWNDLYADIVRFNKRKKPLTGRRIFHLLRKPGPMALFAYRLGRWVRQHQRRVIFFPVVATLKPLYWLLTGYVRTMYDIHLDSTAEIGPGLFIGHFGGIHLSHCRLGAHCSIFQEVYLGPAAHGGDGPTVGDRVWFGPLATVDGPLRVGNNATLGAGCVAVQDVPPVSLVVGNPGRIVNLNYDNSKILDP